VLPLLASLAMITLLDLVDPHFLLFVMAVRIEFVRDQFFTQKPVRCRYGAGKRRPRKILSALCNLVQFRCDTIKWVTIKQAPFFQAYPSAKDSENAGEYITFGVPYIPRFLLAEFA